MLKTVTAFSVVFALLITIALPSVSAKSASEKQVRFTEKVKAGIFKLGTGPQARVEVKLRDKTKLSGYISEANETSFVVTDANGAKVPRAVVVASGAGERLAQAIFALFAAGS